MALVVNLQRKIKVDSKKFIEFSNLLSSTVGDAANGDFSVAFISDRRMKELNSFFRGIDSTTDVLSFPHEEDEFESTSSSGFDRPDSLTLTADAGIDPGPEKKVPAGGSQNKNYLGDIVISVEQADRQSKENGLALENEIQQLILHGLLHLCGYDHEIDDGEMNQRELRLRRKLKI
ncbi:MAG: rRNA maturation RNase YbeY [Acidobacteriota bacterium]